MSEKATGVIRKVSVGPDYKSGAMHYLVGSDVGDGKAVVDSIRQTGPDEFKVFVLMNGNRLLWKKFVNCPIHIEYDLNFNDNAL